MELSVQQVLQDHDFDGDGCVVFVGGHGSCSCNIIAPKGGSSRSSRGCGGCRASVRREAAPPAVHGRGRDRVRDQHAGGQAEHAQGHGGRVLAHEGGCCSTSDTWCIDKATAPQPAAARVPQHLPSQGQPVDPTAAGTASTSDVVAAQQEPRLSS